MVPPRPAITVVGNMFYEGVETVLERLVKGYFDSFAENANIYTLFQQMILDRQLNPSEQRIKAVWQGLNLSRSESSKDAANLILQSPNSIRWEMSINNSYNGFFSALPLKKRKDLFADSAEQYLASFEQDRLRADAWFGHHKLIIEQGQPKFVYDGKYEQPIRGNKSDLAHYWHGLVRHLLEFGRILGAGRQDFFGILCKRLSLTEPPKSLEQLLARLWAKFYGDELKKDSFVAEEVQRGLRGEEPGGTPLYPGDRRQASEWFRSLNYLYFLPPQAES
ncbi:MAG: hypothetical protein M1142_05040 [Patescibacteria group bacterium]|nr:hypothetical protein [Patescibacteria group bacterium]